MATLRLNKGMRDELYSYAKTLIAFPDDDKAAEDAQALAEKLAREAIAKSIPDADLAVLIKYEAVERTSRYHFTHNGIDRWFTFPDHETSPMFFWRRAVLGDEKLFKAFENAQFTKDQRASHRSQIEQDYNRLIQSARTFEELAELWPEVEVMREKAVSCLSVEALERIKADIASRKQEV